MYHNSLCEKCGLWKDAKHPCVTGRGDPSAKLLILGEALGEQEDLQGLPFVGSSGQRLQAYLDRLNIKYYISNAVKCRPTSKSLNRKGETILHNRTPTAKEIKLCSAKTYQLIDKIKPTVILTLGSIPVTQLLHLGLSMTSVRGRTYYHPQLECHIVPTWHPAYLGYSGDKLVEKQFMQDLHQAIELLKAPRVRQINSNPRSLQDPVEIKEYLEYLNTIEECAIDLETTGLNPRKDRITDISLCAKCGEGVHIRWIDILPYFECLKKLLEKPELKCVFQNGKFDTAFLKAIGINVANFYFDTQLAYHTTTMTFEGEGKSLYSLEVMSWLLTREGNYKAILEEFGGIAGHQNGILQKKAEKKEKEIKKEQEKKEEKKKEQKSEKTKQVIRVPVVECNSLFDDMAEPVVKTNIANEYFSHLSTEEDGKFLEKFTPAKKLRRTLLEEDPNIFIINEEQEKELQTYVTFVSDKLKKKLESTKLTALEYYSAMDADVTFEIYKRLKPQIDSEFKEVFYDLIMPLSSTLQRLEQNGILLDTPYIDMLLDENRARTAEIKNSFFKKVKKEFNMDSPKELREVIYDHLRIPVEEEYMTNGGKSGVKMPSTDKNAIEYLAKKHPILNGIVEYRKLEKENSTYLDGFKNHVDPVTGRIHTSFLQHATATGRLSCIAEGTKIAIVGEEKNIEDVQPGDFVYNYDNDGNLTISKVLNKSYSGYGDCVRVKWQSSGNGKIGELICTPEHRILHKYNGWTEAKDLKHYDKVYHLRKGKTYSYDPRPRLYGTNSFCEDEQRFIKRVYFKADPKKTHIHHIDHNPSNNRISNLEILDSAEHNRYHSRLLYEKGIVSERHMHTSEAHAKRLQSLKYGKDNPTYIYKTKEELIQMLKDAKGIVTHIPMDFLTYKQKCETEGINLKELCDCFSRGKFFISQEDVFKVWDKYKDYEYPIYRCAGELHISQDKFKRLLKYYDISTNHVILSVKPAGKYHVWDLEIENYPNFIANEICVHNSSAPNTQNIPRDNRIRNMIIPREGCKLVTADLSQAELRILAMMADDKKMIDAFASGYDFHAYTACAMFGIKPEIFDKENNPDHKAKRSLAKNINFGIAYQMSANSLASDVNISLKEAQDFIDKFYNTYFNVKRWIDKTKSFALKNGYVQTLHGRRRYLPYVHSSDQKVREGALRQAVNTPIQGTASDCACFGLIRIQKFIDEKQLKTKPIMIIHDEIVLETPFEEVELMVEKLPYFMTQNLPKVTIPLVADAEVLTRWKK